MKATAVLLSESYFRHIRFATRALFTLLTVSYFLLVLQQESTSLWQLSLVGAYGLAYLVIQGYWHYQAPRFAPWFVTALDIITLGIVLWLDPVTPPPTLVLLFSLLLKTQHTKGLSNFAITLMVIVVVSLVALPLYLAHATPADTISAIFTLLFLVLTFASLGTLMKQQLLARKRLAKRQWQDPETGLVTHHTLILTADWLLPLHSRLGAPLTAMLMSPIETEEFNHLCDFLQMRLRRSDIIARLSAEETTLAVLLPDTSLANTEALIHLIRPQAPKFQAVIMAVPDTISLEMVLERLRQTQQRTPQPPQEEIYHAGTTGIS